MRVESCGLNPAISTTSDLVFSLHRVLTLSRQIESTPVFLILKYKAKITDLVNIFESLQILKRYPFHTIIILYDSLVQKVFRILQENEGHKFEDKLICFTE
jgi:hypothetical protein